MRRPIPLSRILLGLFIAMGLWTWYVAFTSIEHATVSAGCQFAMLPLIVFVIEWQDSQRRKMAERGQMVRARS